MAAFKKGYSSPFDLVQLLKSRGLIITDEERAETYITNIGYYRLSAYIQELQKYYVGCAWISTGNSNLCVTKSTESASLWKYT